MAQTDDIEVTGTIQTDPNGACWQFQPNDGDLMTFPQPAPSGFAVGDEVQILCVQKRTRNCEHGDWALKSILRVPSVS